MGCLSSSFASVLINGSPTLEFPITKGIRQGDPLSPFLFIIAMEGLNVALKTACNKGLFRGVQLPNLGPSISNLFYADDAIFMGDWEINNIRNLSKILRCFHATSGLQVNFHKSKLFGIGTSHNQASQWARSLGCVAGSLPFIYLGVPVGANMSHKKHWQPVIDRFSNKLSGWKARNLYFGGRLTLVKSVLSSLPTYDFSLFNAPRCVIDQLEQIRRHFLWGSTYNKKKINWVAWSQVMY